MKGAEPVTCSSRLSDLRGCGQGQRRNQRGQLLSHGQWMHEIPVRADYQCRQVNRCDCRSVDTGPSFAMARSACVCSTGCLSKKPRSETRLSDSPPRGAPCLTSRTGVPPRRLMRRHQGRYFATEPMWMARLVHPRRARWGRRRDRGAWRQGAGHRRPHRNAADNRGGPSSLSTKALHPRRTG